LCTVIYQLAATSTNSAQTNTGTSMDVSQSTYSSTNSSTPDLRNLKRKESPYQSNSPHAGKVQKIDQQKMIVEDDGEGILSFLFCWVHIICLVLNHVEDVILWGKDIQSSHISGTANDESQ
jgi:hypothetical protein